MANSLPERIALEITKRIQGGELPPESHLSTQKLADDFDVSRSPVREAMQLLADRGVLEQRPNRGYFVKRGIRMPKGAADMALHSDAPEVYYRFAEEWLEGALPQEISEQFLRDRYTLTRAQGAEFLARAANEGWVERKEGYGWRLVEIADIPEVLAQIYRFRSVIEPAALLQPGFVLNRQAIDLHRRVMLGLLDGAIERWPAARLLDSGIDFHEDLAKMSGNPFFYQSVVRVNRVRRLIDYRMVIDRERFYIQARDHLEMLDLLDRGRNRECSQLMQKHLGDGVARKSFIHSQLEQKLG